MTDGAASPDLFAQDEAQPAPEREPERISVAAQVDVDAQILTASKIIASPSLGAFLSMRVHQATKHGHTPEADLDRDPLLIARGARDRVRAACELLDGREPPPKRIEDALKKVETAGAMLLALHDRLHAELARQSVHQEGE